MLRRANTSFAAGMHQSGVFAPARSRLLLRGKVSKGAATRLLICRAASSEATPNGTDKRNIWESVRIVCDDGVVPASLEVLCISSPLLRSKIETALEQMALFMDDRDGGCYSLAQPLELQMPATTVEEWQMLLKQLYLEFPRPKLDLDTTYKLLPLAHKAGMTQLLGYLDSLLEETLPTALSMEPNYPGYMIKWLVLADRLQLTRTLAVCVSSVEPDSALASRQSAGQFLNTSFVGHTSGIACLAPQVIWEELAQLSPGTLVKLLAASSRVCTKYVNQAGVWDQ